MKQQTGGSLYWKKLVVLFASIVMFSTLISCSGSSKYMIKQTSQDTSGYEKNSCKVVFLRPVNAAFGFVPVLLTSDGKYLGESLARSQFTVSLPAGKYTFISWSENTHAMKANLQAGKTYYVRLMVHMGTWAPRIYPVPLKPGSKLWSKKDEFLKGSTVYKPDREAGQKAMIDERYEEAKEVMANGLKRFESYTDEEKKERTMNPEDGI